MRVSRIVANGRSPCGLRKCRDKVANPRCCGVNLPGRQRAHCRGRRCDWRFARPSAPSSSAAPGVGIVLPRITAIGRCCTLGIGDEPGGTRPRRHLLFATAHAARCDIVSMHTPPRPNSVCATSLKPLRRNWDAAATTAVGTVSGGSKTAILLQGKSGGIFSLDLGNIFGGINPFFGKAACGA
jgi:hypothetical protein